MKRGPSRAWPKGIVEVAATRHDSRADPQATQKISREQLEEALKRTKSGTRAAVRSEPDLDGEGYAGPRDDSPQVTIVRIDSIELETIDPSSLPPAGTMPVIVTTPMDVAASLPRPASSPQPVSGSPLPTAMTARAVDMNDSGAHDRASGPRVVDRRRAPSSRLQITPRVAFIVGLAVVVALALAAFLGFFAGRGVPGLK